MMRGILTKIRITDTKKCNLLENYQKSGECIRASPFTIITPLIAAKTFTAPNYITRGINCLKKRRQPP